MKHTCPECGSSTQRYWHKLTPGLVTTLVKVYAKVCEKQENKVEKSELDLDHSEYGNFQKLRLHALIAKYKEDGRVHRGTWVITKRGADFLKGKIEIPDRVRTFLNRVEAHSDNMVNVTRVMAGNPYWEEHSDFVNQESTLSFLSEPVVEQVSVVVKPTKKIKGKKYCPKCEAQMKIDYSITNNFSGSELYKYRKEYICPSCEYRIQV